MTDSDDRIARRYRELAREEPQAALDEAILAASRRAVARPTSASRWAAPVSIAAVLVLAFGVTLQMQREEPGVESSAPLERQAAAPAAPAPSIPPAPAEQTPASPAMDAFVPTPKPDRNVASRKDKLAAQPEPMEPLRKSTVAKPTSETPPPDAPAPSARYAPEPKQEREVRAEKKAVPLPEGALPAMVTPPPIANAAPGASASPAAPTVSGSTSATIPASVSAPPAMPSPPKAANMASPSASRVQANAPAPRAETSTAPSAGAPAALPERALASPLQESVARAAPRQKTEASDAAAAPRDVIAQTPIERELERIAKLRQEGRDADADRALEQFRRDHPDYRIAAPMWERVKPR